MLTESDILNVKSVSGREVAPGYAAPGTTLNVECAKKWAVDTIIEASLLPLIITMNKTGFKDNMKHFISLNLWQPAGLIED